MVVFYISGGLANKMFQYAFSLHLKQAGFYVIYDTQSFDTEFNHDTIQLTDVFSELKIENVENRPFKLIGKRDLKSRILRRFSANYIFEKDFKYDRNIISRIKQKCCVDGLWQDSRYFEGCIDEVHSAFKFPVLLDVRNIMIEESMKAENSIAIHIRKGDGYGLWDIFSNTCEKDYYDKAISFINNHVDKPTFYVFSDSPEIVDRYLDIDNYTLINWNPKTGKDSYIDMQLMSCAKHNIIANSTYSWWGSWLNKNPDKIIIAPLNWFNPAMKRRFKNYNIVPSSWVKF